MITLQKIEIRRLTKFTKATLTQINQLLPQLLSSDRALSADELKAALKGKSIYIFAMFNDNKIIGIGTLVVMPTIIGLRARIEDVVIDNDYRGQGLGERLMKHLIAKARSNKIESIELTSRPARLVANSLYEKLGFEKKETNTYIMKLKSS